MDQKRSQQYHEQLQARYIGVGDADTTREEWRANVARDSYASYIGHPGLLQQFSVALGEPRALTRKRFIDSMINPNGNGNGNGNGNNNS
uniref:ARAD1B04400p n=1 Tax=Blastobotrys adeninivorans TaxID=409370 RepID=A0A060T4L5_BLAAD